MKIISYLPFILLAGIFARNPGSSLKSQCSEFVPSSVGVSFNGIFIPKPAREGGNVYSGNGRYSATYEVVLATDENRKLVNFRLYEGQELIYRLAYPPGADLYVSNEGYVAFVNMDRHFLQEVTLHMFSPEGKMLWSKTFRYVSVFGFSGKGDVFVAATDKNTFVINAGAGSESRIARCSEFSFSADGNYLVTAFENMLSLYDNLEPVRVLDAGIFYPRAVAIDMSRDLMGVIDKHNLKVYQVSDGSNRYNYQLKEPLSYRDLQIADGKVLAGVHEKHHGISRGIIQVYDSEGNLVNTEEGLLKEFEKFTGGQPAKQPVNGYDQIPWPFVPFDQVHKVWNHYEQHMGNGSGDWAYLHQGLDIETPINEPTYAVEAGWVKLVLTIGGASYWRLAISPVQSSGYSDGWLYAHLVESSIQVDVGDYVNLHEYLGDIIYWSGNWGHIHFVNIHDQGEIWYYDDDEWGINFNPLLALNPNTDLVPPIIENFSTGSKFGFCLNESSSYLEPENLHSDIDIVVKISDYHGTSEWEQPAYKTYYWLNKLPEMTSVVPKTLGHILNHAYSQYNSSFYEAYASVLYKKDAWHPSPPWMNWDRDYYHILTNNNGDSIIDPGETQLSFKTNEFPDGNYRLYVEAWDEYGNMALDSQDVVFDNFNTAIHGHNVFTGKLQATCSPNPVNQQVTIFVTGLQEEDRLMYLEVYTSTLQATVGLSVTYDPGSHALTVDAGILDSGLYLFRLQTTAGSVTGKFIRF